jgi:hypothetical protein
MTSLNLHRWSRQIDVATLIGRVNTSGLPVLNDSTHEVSE